MKVAYCGNFTVPWTTENEIRRALTEGLGHDVHTVQEGETQPFVEMTERADEFDLILWTRTASLARKLGTTLQRDMLLHARRVGTPTASIHLDRFWGLGKGAGDKDREAAVWSEPFFRCEHFFSTDGAHNLEWSVAGVNHHWLPPAVSEFECVPGTARDEYAADVAFFGTVDGYHREHGHRQELVRWLRATYGDRFRLFPDPGRPSLRGEALRDAVASVKVIVGDSCLSPRADGSPMVRYWSDRVPEITGRGGFLVHPYVEGLADFHPSVPMWEMGEWDDLRGMIAHFLHDEARREQVATYERAETLERNTYTVRMEQVLELVAPYPPATAGERAFYANSGWR